MSSLRVPLHVVQKTEDTLSLKNSPFREGFASFILIIISIYPLVHAFELTEVLPWETLFMGKAILFTFVGLLWTMALLTFGEFEYVEFRLHKSMDDEYVRGTVTTTSVGVFTKRTTQRSLDGLSCVYLETTTEKKCAYRIGLHFEDGTIVPLRECFVYEFFSNGDLHRKVARDVADFLRLSREDGVEDFEWKLSPKNAHDLLSYGQAVWRKIKGDKGVAKEKVDEDEDEDALVDDDEMWKRWESSHSH